MSAIKQFTKFLVNPDEKYMIIQGSAGTGKSTLIEYLIKSLDSQLKMYELLLRKNKTQTEWEAVLTATTNKAAAVLKELTGMETQTIHSLLRLIVRPNVITGTVKLSKKKDRNLLYNKLIILDEASMMNDELFEILEETIVDCKVVFIGDKYQLAPVRQKIPVMDTIQCPTATLHKVMRHAGDILHTSAQFRDTVEDSVWAEVPDLPTLQKVDGPTFQKLIDAAFTDKNYNSSTAKVLAWTNKRVMAYNAHIRQLKGFPPIITEGEVMFTNKPIMAGRDNWATDSKIYITEVGPLIVNHKVEGRMVEINNRVSFFNPEDQNDARDLFKRLAKAAKVDGRKWQTFFELKEGWLDLRPAYASTVHKAQGATYDTVFIDLGDIGRCNIESDVARMMYVSISRAANQVYFYGELPSKYQEQ